MMFSICCLPASAVSAAVEENAVKETVEAYLRPKTESIYLYGHPASRITAPKTLLDVLNFVDNVESADMDEGDDAMHLTAEEQANMAAFAEDAPLS